jgi:FMN reductase [NAD(P)H]
MNNQKDIKENNEVLKVFMERASCRNFSPRKIPRDVLDSILESGVNAASGGNLQPSSVIVVEDEEKNRKLAKMCGQGFIGDASVNLLFCVDWYRLKRLTDIEKAPFTAMSSFRHFWISFQDTVIFAQTICTAGDLLGLGTVYIGTIVDHLMEIKDMFKLPDGVAPVVMVCMGYPKSKLNTRKKYDLNTMVHREKYHDPTDEEIIESHRNKYSDFKTTISHDVLERIRNVCLNVHGEDFANECIEKIKSQGYVGMPHYTFGLHYRADMIPLGNTELLEIFKNLGFHWFEEFKA